MTQMDENLLRFKNDKKIKSLEKQVDYFRSQALRLKTERDGTPGSPAEFVAKIASLKEKLDCAQQDKKYFEAFVVEARKENKELKDLLAARDKDTLDKVRAFAKADAQARLLARAAPPPADRLALFPTQASPYPPLTQRQRARAREPRGAAVSGAPGRAGAVCRAATASSGRRVSRLLSKQRAISGSGSLLASPRHTSLRPRWCAALTRE